MTKTITEGYTVQYSIVLYTILQIGYQTHISYQIESNVYTFHFYTFTHNRIEYFALTVFTVHHEFAVTQQR
jgi:hypothetical protein